MVGLAGLSQHPGPYPESGHDRIGEARIDEIRFRDYRLLPTARILLKDRDPVAIGSRAFDILHVLARSRGSIVGKREIVDSVWPTTTVEESNLRFQVAQLRKALAQDQDLIKTIPGRGYLLTLEEEGNIPAVATVDVQLLELSAARTSIPSPVLHLVDQPTTGSGATRGGHCPDLRMLLQELMHSLDLGEGEALILCLRAGR